MQITTTRAALLHELQALSDVVEKREVIPVLTQLCFRVGSTVTISATNGQDWLTTPAQAQVIRQGSVLLPAVQFQAFLRVLPEGDVCIAASQKSVIVSAGDARASFALLDVQDFPLVPEAPVSTHAVRADELQRLIRETRYAMGGYPKMQIKGALCELGSVIRVVATDGHRTVISTGRVEEGQSLSLAFVAHPNSWQGLDKMLGLCAPETHVAIVTDDNRAWFSAEGRVYVAQLLEPKFPDYKRFIRNDHAFRAVISRDSLRSALRRVQVATSAERIGMTMDISDGRAKCEARSADRGEVKDSVALNEACDPVQIQINPRYVLDFLESVDSDVVSMAFRSATDIASLQPVGAEQSTTCLIALMRF